MSPRHLRHPHRGHFRPHFNPTPPFVPIAPTFMLPPDVGLILSGIAALLIGILLCFVFWPIGLAFLGIGGALLTGGVALLRRRRNSETPPPVTNVHVEVKNEHQTSSKDLKLETLGKLKDFKKSEIKKKPAKNK